MLDLTNQRFGKLLALCPTDERKGGSVVWKCLCDCGNTVHVVSRDLTSNKKRPVAVIKQNASINNM